MDAGGGSMGKCSGLFGSTRFWGMRIGFAVKVNANAT